MAVSDCFAMCVHEFKRESVMTNYCYVVFSRASFISFSKFAISMMSEVIVTLRKTLLSV